MNLKAKCESHSNIYNFNSLRSEFDDADSYCQWLFILNNKHRLKVFFDDTRVVARFTHRGIVDNDKMNNFELKEGVVLTDGLGSLLGAIGINFSNY